jgi:hypothetical protein
MMITKLLDAADNGSSLANFMTGDGFSSSISAILSDISKDAANFAINMVKSSKYPRDRINSAINHLEVAHIYNKNAYSKYKILMSLNIHNDIVEFDLAIERDIFICWSMALAYAYLEDDIAARKSLDLAEEAYAIYEESRSPFDEDLLNFNESRIKVLDFNNKSFVEILIPTIIFPLKLIILYNQGIRNSINIIKIKRDDLNEFQRRVEKLIRT